MEVLPTGKEQTYNQEHSREPRFAVSCSGSDSEKGEFIYHQYDA
jgi:hypothetical protein